MHLEQDSNLEQIKELIEMALSNNHAKYEKINNINEYFTAKTLANSLYKLADSFSKTATNVYKEYITSLKKRIDNYQLLIDYRVIKQCEKYYLEEYFNTVAVIDEYREYLATRNFFDSVFFGHDRRDDEDYE